MYTSIKKARRNDFRLTFTLYNNATNPNKSLTTCNSKKNMREQDISKASNIHTPIKNRTLNCSAMSSANISSTKTRLFKRPIINQITVSPKRTTLTPELRRFFMEDNNYEPMSTRRHNYNARGKLNEKQLKEY